MGGELGAEVVSRGGTGLGIFDKKVVKRFYGKASGSL